MQGVNHDMKPALEQHLLRSGGVLLPAPDGPLLDTFSALELAQAIEQEVNRAAMTGLPKLSLKMDLQDAMAMAAFLRRAVNKGA